MKRIIIKRKYLHEALEIDIDKKNIISVVGAGGKTSTIFELAYELINKNKRVAVITTTKMFKPEKYGVFEDDFSKIKETLEKHSLVIAGKIIDTCKITYIGDSIFWQLYNICDCILVEADGSKGLPLKCPGTDEPQIMEGSNLVISVVGIDAVGKEIKECCHRSNIAAKILKIHVDEKLSVANIAYLLASKRVGRKGTCKRTAYLVLINKVESNDELNSALEISQLLKRRKITSIISSIKNKEYYSIK